MLSTHTIDCENRNLYDSVYVENGVYVEMRFSKLCLFLLELLVERELAARAKRAVFDAWQGPASVASQSRASLAVVVVVQRSPPPRHRAFLGEKTNTRLKVSSRTYCPVCTF